jgi:hypothetical protein
MEAGRLKQRGAMERPKRDRPEATVGSEVIVCGQCDWPHLRQGERCPPSRMGRRILSDIAFRREQSIRCMAHAIGHSGDRAIVFVGRERVLWGRPGRRSGPQPADEGSGLAGEVSCHLPNATSVPTSFLKQVLSLDTLRWIPGPMSILMAPKWTKRAWLSEKDLTLTRAPLKLIQLARRGRAQT